MVSWLANQSSNPAVGDRFPGGENMNLLYNSDIVSLLLKTNAGRDRRPNFVCLIFCILECFNCWWVVGGGAVEQKVLFSTN